MPGQEGGGDPFGGTGGPAQRLRSVLVLPFINKTNDADLAFWSIPFSVLYVSDMRTGSFAHDLNSEPDLLEEYMLGERSAQRPADVAKSLEIAGGDTVLVSSYDFGGNAWTISGEVFDETDLSRPFDRVQVSDANPYVALQRYGDAWLPKLGQAVQAGGMTGGPGGPGGPGMPAPGGGSAGIGPPGGPGSAGPPPGVGAGSAGIGPPGAPGAPGFPTPGAPGAGTGSAGFGPPGAPGAPGFPGGEGGEGFPGDQGMPGMPGMPGGQQVTYRPVDVENWARGVASWPFDQPEDVYRGDIEQAIRYFDKQLEVEPEFNLGYTSAAIAYIAIGEEDRGIAIQRAYVESQPENPADRHNYGMVLAIAGRVDEAVTNLRQSLEQAEGLLLGDAILITTIYIQAERYDDAVRVGREFIDQYPYLRPLYVLVGGSLLELEDPTAAAEMFRAAGRLNPNTFDAYSGLTQAYIDQGAVASAIDVAQRATQVLPDDHRAWSTLAEARLAGGAADKAIEAAEQAIAVAENEAGAHQMLGEALLAAGRVDEAGSAFQQASELDRQWNKPRRFLGRAQLQAGELDRAAELLTAALQTAGMADMNETAREYARLMFYRGEFAEAQRYVQLSLDFEPDNAPTLMLRSLLRLYEGDDPAAWEDFNLALRAKGASQAMMDGLPVLQAAAADDDRATAWAMLGIIFEQFGDPGRARDAYRRYRAEAGAGGFLRDLVNERLEATRER